MNGRVSLELFLSGVLLGAGPCLLSCGPILLSFLTGAKKTVKASIVAYVVFSCARIVAYLFLSIVIFWAGKIFTEAILGGLSRYMLISLGAVLLLLGILIVSDVSKLKNRWCTFFSRHLIEHDKKSIVVVGLLIGLIPCGPFVGILSYIGLIAKTWQASVGYSVLFGLGTFVSPLILLVVATGFLPKLVSHYAGYYRFARIISGIILMWLGLRSFSAGLQL